MTANELRTKIAELADSSVDAPRSKIIDEARSYLAGHAEETGCPLCETQFEQPLETILVRLKERSDALLGLRNATSNRKAALDRIKRYADDNASQLKRDLQHSKLFDSTTRKGLRDARASALRFYRRLVRAIGNDFTGDIALPDAIVYHNRNSECARDHVEGEERCVGAAGLRGA